MAYYHDNNSYANTNQYSHSDSYPPSGPGGYGNSYQHDSYGDANHNGYTAQPPHNNNNNSNYGYDPQSDWETKSYKSSNTYHSQYAGSEAHLNPQYEMSQVSIPPVPSVPYNQQAYPPYQQRPLVSRDQSSAGWSVAKEKLMKRRSVRQVELYQGNLVLDVPVPSHIVPRGSGAGEEMTKMRYTAATCDPDDFMRQKYSLRPYLYKRRTEIFIVMTMYNEDEVLFVKTMNAYVYWKKLVCQLFLTLL